MRYCPTYRIVAAATLVAALSGCQSLGIVSSCSDYPFLWSASTNVVMLPFSSFGDRDSEALASSLHVNVMASLSEFEGTKVIRLKGDGAAKESCSPPAVMRAWSGCSFGPRVPVLIPREPVILVWANTFEREQELLVQFNVRMWRVNTRDQLELKFNIPGQDAVTVVAPILSRQIAFSVRRLKAEDLATLQRNLVGEGLRRSPDANTHLLSHVDLSERAAIAVKRSKSVDNATWLDVTIGSASGWIQLPSQALLQDRFPELATAYFEFLRHPRDGDINRAQRALEKFVQAEARLAGDRDQRPIGVARQMFATMLLLEGFRKSDSDQLRESQQQLVLAGQAGVSRGDLENLSLMAELGLCCGVAKPATDSESGLMFEFKVEPSATAMLEPQFAKLMTAIGDEPTNQMVVANSAAVAGLLKHAGVRDVSGLNVEEVHSRLAAAASRPLPLSATEAICRSKQ